MKTFKILNKLLSGLIIIITFIFFVGITYSFFTADITGKEIDKTITADAGKMEIIYDGGAEITASGIQPSIEPFAIKNFTITATSTVKNANIKYKLILIIDENTFSENAISYTLNSENTSSNGEVAPTVSVRRNVNKLSVDIGRGQFTGEFSNAVHTYHLNMYFYETGENQSADMSKRFKAHVDIENDQVQGSLRDKILSQGGGITAIESKGKPNFNQISSLEDTGLYKDEDEYGATYYYRGDKHLLNNNLIFGGFQWKIIRINGDSSIRLLYNGTEEEYNTNGIINLDGLQTQIKTAEFNSMYFNDAKYVGYMYGGANGVASMGRNGSVSMAATYNETSSNLKNQLETWYQEKLLGKSFERHIVDNVFCNDRQLQSEAGGAATGPGFGLSPDTYYATYHRLVNSKNPTLKCGLKNDRFTADDASVGNKKNSYPIGIITVDEASMAGLVYNTSNTTNYLYTGEWYWTLSPNRMAEYTYVWSVFSTGLLDAINVVWAGGIRPVINISQEISATGEGSLTNPFKVID